MAQIEFKPSASPLDTTTAPATVNQVRDDATVRNRAKDLQGTRRGAAPRIIALAVNRWEGAWMNRQQILSRLGRNYPVLYSNGAWSTWDVRDPQWRQASWVGGFERRDSILLDRAPALLLRVRDRKWMDERVLRVVAGRWRRRMRREGNGPLVAYVFHPRMWPYARALRPDILLYHAYDLFKLQVGWSDTVACYEHELVRRADLVLGSSQVICDELRALGSSPVLLANGADFDAFAVEPHSPEPADLVRIPEPRIGYIGKLSRKVDLRLIASLAFRHPQWQFVFVGSCDNLDAESAEEVASLRRLPNVHLLGYKEHTQLPDYASRMAVNLICHRVDETLWTRGTFPLKLFEYLAAGRPVVSADIPSVRPYVDVVTIAKTAADWEHELTAILEHGAGAGSRESRQAVARRNTWDHRVAHLDELLGKLVARC